MDGDGKIRRIQPSAKIDSQSEGILNPYVRTKRKRNAKNDQFENLLDDEIRGLKDKENVCGRKKK